MFRLRRLLFPLPLLLLLQTAAADLQELCTDPALWSQTPEKLAAKFKGRLRWTDRNRRVLTTVQSGNTLFGEPVWTLFFRFDAERRLQRIDGALFTRGDAKLQGREAERRDLLDQVGRVAGAVTEAYPEAEPERRRTVLGGAQIVTTTYQLRPDLTLELTTSHTRRGAEYLNFKLTPEREDFRDALRAETDVEDLPQRLKTLPDGGRYLEIPMVDQGRKGYCVAATVERLARYYGSEIDQHIFAQLAGSDAVQGTNMREAVKALEGVDAKLNLRARMFYEYTAFNSWNDLAKMIRQYNREARRGRLEPVEFDDFVAVRGNYRILDYSGLLQALDPETYRKFRLRDQRDYQKFRQKVIASIDQGLPLAWGVGGPYQGGVIRHLRIINGYNPKTDQVIYTDSWGAGHEHKAMSFEEAWSLTTELLEVTPRER